jgi:hypothetical protein
MIASVFGQIKCIDVVPTAGGVGFWRTHPGMFPAVIFHVSKRDDAFAVDAVKRIQPRSIVKVRNVAVVRRVVSHLAIVFRGLQCRSKPRTRDVVRSNKVDGSFVIPEGTGRGIRNIDLLAGLL